MTVITDKNLHTLNEGKVYALTRLIAPAALFLSLIACGETEKQNSGAEELATRNQAAAASSHFFPDSISALDSMELPKARWQNHLKLTYEFPENEANTLAPDYRADENHCPNFDIDGNGSIQMLFDKTPNTNSFLNGDGGMLYEIAMLRFTGSASTNFLREVNALASKAGPNATRNGRKIVVYNHCLRKKFANLGKLKNLDSLYDWSLDNRVEGGDQHKMIYAFTHGMNVLPIYEGSKVAAQFTDKINNHLKICYVFFKFANEPKPRRYQIECGLDGSSSHYFQLPNLTVEKSGTKCTYKEGSTVLATHYLANESLKCGAAPSR